MDGKTTPLATPQSFAAEVLGTASLPPADRAANLAFQQKTARLQRAVLGAVEAANETSKQIALLKKALLDAPAADAALMARARELGQRLKDLEVPLNGDKVVAKVQEPVSPSIVERVQRIVYSLWASSSAPTGTEQRGYEIAAQAFAPVLEKLRVLVEVDLADLEKNAEAAGAPWSGGRVPAWRPE